MTQNVIQFDPKTGRMVQVTVPNNGTPVAPPTGFTGSGSAAPTTAQVAPGTFMVWKNTTDGTVKEYYNDGGTLKSVTLA